MYSQSEEGANKQTNQQRGREDKRMGERRMTGGSYLHHIIQIIFFGKLS
jgi:hypothetical protein